MSPFLHRCQCTRGFFVLRACDAEAPHLCPRCARRVCDQHWSAKQTPPACLECLARADQQRAIDGDDFDSLWFHRYRHRYYTSTHYRPLFLTSVIDPYYNDYDARLLDAAASAGDQDDDAGDDDARGLGDS